MSSTMLRLLQHQKASASAAFLASLIVVLVTACGKKAPEPPVEPPTGTAAQQDDARSIAEAELARLRADLAEAEEEKQRLARELAGAVEEKQRLAGELAELTDMNATLELELGSALEELLRSHANLRNVQSRAFAVSRIAEVRVGLQAFRESQDPVLASRVDRADEFLTRSDSALAEDNVGGAAYLAERAGELLRQLRTISEIRSKGPKELIPLVPAPWLEVETRANLRAGPGVDQKRVRTVEAGTKLRALARQGEWYQVQTEDGTTAWIYRHLVR